jgi:hypothetical protein
VDFDLLRVIVFAPIFLSLSEKKNKNTGIDAFDNGGYATLLFCVLCQA